MDLLDELVAVNVTLEKWENIQEEMITGEEKLHTRCGFCDLYNCASDTCPAFKRCDEIWIIYDAQRVIYKEITKNISWLKKRKTMLTKKIKKKKARAK